MISQNLNCCHMGNKSSEWEGGMFLIIISSSHTISVNIIAWNGEWIYPASHRVRFDMESFYSGWPHTNWDSWMGITKNLWSFWHFPFFSPSGALLSRYLLKGKPFWLGPGDWVNITHSACEPLENQRLVWHDIGEYCAFFSRAPHLITCWNLTASSFRRSISLWSFPLKVK